MISLPVVKQSIFYFGFMNDIRKYILQYHKFKKHEFTDNNSKILSLTFTKYRLAGQKFIDSINKS